MTDDKTRQLENRIDKLESTIEKMMPSRRDALKMGGAALVGGAAMSGTASAGGNQKGTIGASPNDLVDIESEDINNADTVTTNTLDAQAVDAVSVNTGQAEISNETLIRIEKTSDQSISDGVITVIDWDAKVKDERSEFNLSNNEFVPQDTGFYLFAHQVTVQPSDGDRLTSFIFDKTNGGAFQNVERNAGGGNNETLAHSAIIKVTSGEAVNFRVRNLGSNDTVKGSPSRTNCSIRSVFR